MQINLYNQQKQYICFEISVRDFLLLYVTLDSVPILGTIPWLFSSPFFHYFMDLSHFWKQGGQRDGRFTGLR